MKQTLRHAIEKMQEDLIDRIDMLNKHIKEYLDAGNLVDAALNKIKRDTLETVRTRLSETLNKN